jgi:manganese oxidase
VQGGTPVPGVVPLPDQAAPLLPTYGEQGMPGYPFYIAGRPGHRAPQPPLDLARAVDDPARHLDGGLPRHVVTGGARETAAASIPEALAVGDMTAHLESLDLEVLPYDGTPLERRAMAFHHDGRTESGGTLALFDVEGRAASRPAAPRAAAGPSTTGAAT